MLESPRIKPDWYLVRVLFSIKMLYIHLEALITVHVHKGLYLGNRFIDIAQIWKECRQDMCYHMPINVIAKYFILNKKINTV